MQNMKKLAGIAALMAAMVVVVSCSHTETYQERRDKEISAINSYIAEKRVKVISEATFFAQDSVTDVSKNEFVLFEASGVYMQIVRKGCGDKLEEGKSVTLLCRFLEYNIMEDSVLVTNSVPFYFYNSALGQYIDASLFVDKMSVTRTGTTITASFVSGMMLMYHSSSSSVPAGWLVPLNYINVGRPENENDEIAKVRLIVPHSQGTADASSSVYPCFYEITYVREK